MKFKDRTVNPAGIRSELLLALVVADQVWSRLGYELVITSLNDAEHSTTSLHYSGAAADLRTNYFSHDIAAAAADQLRSALGRSPHYDVVLEKDHIHLEYQPKRPTKT